MLEEADFRAVAKLDSALIEKHDGRAGFPLPVAEHSSHPFTEAQGKNYDEFCLDDACHELLDREGLAKMTSYMDRNYHDQASTPHGEVAECGDCHKAHTQSIVMCAQCHGDAEVPEGWLTYDEYKALATA